MSFKKKINDIHDKSYKDLFSTKDTFLSLLNTFVQGDWVDKLDADKLLLMVGKNGLVLGALRISLMKVNYLAIIY